jgi:hypothetical protein
MRGYEHCDFIADRLTKPTNLKMISKNTLNYSTNSVKSSKMHGNQEQNRFAPLDETENTTSPPARRTTENAPVPATTTAADEKTTETWMEIFTIQDFKGLHCKIFEIIERITENHPEHPFTIKWCNLKEQSRYALTRQMEWRQAKFCLEVDDLNHYKDFILRCPAIKQYIKLRNHRKIKGALDYGEIEMAPAIPAIPQDIPFAKDEVSLDSQITQETKTYDVQICTGSTEDIRALFTIVIPILKQYQIDHPEDEYNSLIAEWFQAGLSETSSLQEICNITHTIDLEDICVLLMLAAPLKPYLLIQWEQTYITYTSLQPFQHPSPTLRLVNNDEDIATLHQHVAPMIAQWIDDPADTTYPHIKKSLKAALNKGFLSAKTWNQIQSSLDINHYHEYYYNIYKCPIIQKQIPLQWDNTTNQLGYHAVLSAPPAHTPPIPSVVSAPPTPTISEAMYLPLLTDHTPRVDNIHNTHGREPDDPAENFGYINATLYNLVDEWTSVPKNSNHPFYSNWARTKYMGFTAITPWTKATSILHIHTTEEYLEFFRKCPYIQSTLKLGYDKAENNIIHEWVQQPTLEDAENTGKRATRLHNKFLDLTYRFEHRYNTISTKLDEIGNNITYYHDKVTSSIHRGTQALTTHTNAKIKQLQTIATEHKEDIANSVKSNTASIIAHAQETLQSITSRNIQHFKDMLQEQYDKETQKIAEKIDEAITKVQQLTETQNDQRPTPSNIASTTSPYAQPSKRFPNVNPETLNRPLCRYNPYADNTDTSVTPIHTGPTQQQTEISWDRFGPHDTDQPPEVRPLPQLFAHKLISQVKVPYTGFETTYTWYHTLRSSVQQYGIILLNIEQISLNKSLCPTQYYGTTIDTIRYRDMANALYQLLVLPDTIPYEYTELRNILHRNATTSDGYVTLYDIMEQIHPVLNQDAKLRQPTTTHSTDIHDYYRQYDSYLLHNRLMGVDFTTRRKVNLFIEGLDPTYQIAINRLKQHMMTWRQNDPTPPDDLQIPVLARTVERIMQDSTDTAVIRALHRNQTHPYNNSYTKDQKDHPYSPKPKDHRHSQSTPRAFVDIKCSYCKRHGHKKINCDKMAQHLILQDNVKSIDEKQKAQLITQYLTTMAERRTRRMARIKHTVRQLYSEGQAEQADTLLEQCMSHNPTHDSGEDASTSTQDS